MRPAPRPVTPFSVFSPRRKSLFAFLLLSAVVQPVPLVHAQNEALTIPRNLAELVGESERIVQGRVTNVALQPHPQLPNLMTVAVTLQIEDTLKGPAVPSYMFSQAVIDKRQIQSMMGYRTGQHLLLILIHPSAYGLSSPAGLQQGRFSLAVGSGGKLQATNGFGNAGLFKGLESHLRTSGRTVSPEIQAMLAQKKPGPVALEELKKLIRTLAPGAAQQ